MARTPRRTADRPYRALSAAPLPHPSWDRGAAALAAPSKPVPIDEFWRRLGL